MLELIDGMKGIIKSVKYVMKIVDESVSHLIVDCGGYERERELWMYELNIALGAWDMNSLAATAAL